MRAELSLKTSGDPDLEPLVLAQEVEVMARYGVGDAGPAPSPGTPYLLARVAGRPVGCVALARLSEDAGEVKRMYVEPSARGHKLGRLLLEGVEALARERGYGLLRLETGTQQPEALRLYETAGWSRIPCYGYFKDDPTTICLEKRLAG